MLQRSPITLLQVKAGSTSDKPLKKIRQIIYSFFRAIELTRKVNKSIMKSI